MKTTSRLCKFAVCIGLTIGMSVSTGCGGGSGATLTSPQSLAILTSSMPDGTIGSAYTQPIQATGGVVAPFRWGVTSGALPHNLALENSTEPYPPISSFAVVRLNRPLFPARTTEEAR